MPSHVIITCQLKVKQGIKIFLREKNKERTFIQPALLPRSHCTPNSHNDKKSRSKSPLVTRRCGYSYSERACV